MIALSNVNAVAPAAYPVAADTACGLVLYSKPVALPDRVPLTAIVESCVAGVSGVSAALNCVIVAVPTGNSLPITKEVLVATLTYIPVAETNLLAENQAKVDPPSITNANRTDSKATKNYRLIDLCTIIPPYENLFLFFIKTVID